MSKGTEEASEEASLKVQIDGGQEDKMGPGHAGSQMSRKLKKGLAQG